MLYSATLFASAFLLLVQPSDAFFSVYDDYFSSPKFVVKYDDLNTYTKQESERILQGTSANGSHHLMRSDRADYLCHIPQFTQSELVHPTINGSNEFQSIQLAYSIINESLHDMDLFLLGGNQAYWSYAFRFGRDLSQFHGDEKDFAKGTTAKYFLGRFKQGNDADTYFLSKESGSFYLRHNLESGTVCDLTGRQRSTEVQFVCDSSQNQVSLNWVREYKSCQYQAQISVPGLCSNDLLGSNREEPPQEIQCTKIIDMGNNVADKALPPRISIAEYKLHSAGNGIFLGIPKFSDGVNIFIYHSDELERDSQIYLKEVAKAFFLSITRKQVFINETTTLTHAAKFSYYTHVYGRKGSYLTTIEIEKMENGQVIIYDKGYMVEFEKNFDLDFEARRSSGEQTEKKESDQRAKEDDVDLQKSEPEHGQLGENGEKDVEKINPVQIDQETSEVIEEEPPELNQKDPPVQADAGTSEIAQEIAPQDTQEAQHQDHEDQKLIKHDEL